MYRLFLFVFIASLTVFGCSQNDQSSTDTEVSDARGGDDQVGDPATEMEEAMRALQESLAGEDGDGKKVEVTDYQKLKDFMPKRLVGMKQEDLSGEKTSAMGFRFSSATATYRDQEREVEVSIADFGGIGVLKATMAAWTNMEYERESDDGYERTTTIAGYPAFENFDRTTGNAELGILVDDRLILSVDAENISEKDFKRLIEQLDAKKLARVK